MSNIIPFDFETNAVRIVMRDGAPWFVAADVCRVLGISKHRDAIGKLDDDERSWAKVDAFSAIDRTAASARDLVLKGAWWDERSGDAMAQDFLGLLSIRKEAVEAGAEFANNLELLRASQDPAEKLRVALDLRDQLLDAAGGVKALNEEQRAFYDNLVTVIRNLGTLGAEVARPELDAISRYVQTRIVGETHLKSTLAAQAAEAAKIYGVYVRTRAEAAGNLSAAQEKLAAMRQENTLAALILQHGENSAEVARHRALAAREATLAEIEAQDVADSLKEELRRAADSALLIATTDSGSGRPGRRNQERAA